MAFSWSNNVTSKTKINKAVITELVEKANTAVGYTTNAADAGNKISLTVSDTPSSKDLILLYQQIDNIHSLGITCSSNNVSNLQTVHSTNLGTNNSGQCDTNNGSQLGTVNSSNCNVNDSWDDDADEYTDYQVDGCSVDNYENYGSECFHCPSDSEEMNCDIY